MDIYTWPIWSENPVLIFLIRSRSKNQWGFDFSGRLLLKNHRDTLVFIGLLLVTYTWFWSTHSATTTVTLTSHQTNKTKSVTGHLLSVAAINFSDMPSPPMSAHFRRLWSSWLAWDCETQNQQDQPRSVLFVKTYLGRASALIRSDSIFRSCWPIKSRLKRMHRD